MTKKRLNLQNQAVSLEHFVASTTARFAVDLIGVNSNTSSNYFQRLREIITYVLEQTSHGVFDGE